MNSIRVAVIGIGAMGSYYARLLKEMRGVDLVAVCGRSPSPVEKLSQDLHVVGYADGKYEQLLADFGCTQEELASRHRNAGWGAPWAAQGQCRCRVQHPDRKASWRECSGGCANGCGGPSRG